MRAVVQRVKKASVRIENQLVGEIGPGLLVLLAVQVADEEKMIPKMAEKIINLRIFNDRAGKMNRSLLEVGGEIIIVSQFTLYGDCRKGNRPSFIQSARPDKAIPIYNQFINYLKSQGIKVATGEFGAEMDVELINNGPVTIIIDL
jgi:D-aminoacyl-tRNA deacylase